MSIVHAPGAPSLVAILGPAEGRYFASGYKDVRYDVRDPGLADGSGARMSATYAARYPADWSRAADGEARTPHLSSVDAIALSILTLERFAGPRELGSYRVARVELRAPRQPHTDLDAVPVALRVDGDLGEADLRVDSDVGGIRVRLDVRRCEGDGSRVDEGGSSIYAEEFRQTRIASSLEGHEASAVIVSHLFEADPGSAPPSLTGLESAFAPAVTVIDLLVTLGQTTQAAIYSSLPIEQRRGDLWMRSMVIEVDDRPQPLPFDARSRTAVTRERVLDRGGQKVHDIDVESTLESSVRAWARLAYVEPTTRSVQRRAGQ